ncbi:Alpha/Beta hydrolase protein [Immersiella caudata]|uniref:Alpha/Beta hydrolase protein n=1 Tax=Immersiella caudata TaxID=314043 RepID=A0AA39WLF2_9PEZI|nr:Alpha/Beta hydrolase protein [Immersiella caudata]
MYLASTAFIAIISASIASASASKNPRPPLPPPPKCRSLELSVHATAENIHFTNPPNQNDAAAIRNWLFSALADPTGSYMNGTEPISGVYTVGATYCEPRGNTPRRRHRTLQVLVHGMTYSKELWAGLGASEAYNWHAYATRAGYYTLAVNRLGRGQLDHYPDPITENQSALQDKFTQELLIRLRQGGFPRSLRLPSFEKIIYVGHSFGSALGNHVAADNPEAADAYVLTGYSSTVALPVNLIADFASAAIVNPERFSGLPLGYWAGQTESIRTEYMYAGNYDLVLPPRDFETHDIFAVGEGLSPGFEMRVTAFTGPVVVVTGDLDTSFCPDGRATCMETLERTRELFPLADFSVMMPKDIGHTLTLHLSAPEVIVQVLEWLDSYF